MVGAESELFAPEGHRILAQGNALGKVKLLKISPRVAVCVLISQGDALD